MTRRLLALAAAVAALPLPLPALAGHGPRVTARELAASLARDPDAWLVVDVRSASEFRATGGHIADAVHLAYPGIKEAAATALHPTDGQTIVLVCFTGHRSQWSMDAVAAATGAPVVDLKGGMLAWWAADLPVVVEPDAEPMDPAATEHHGDGPQGGR